MKTTPSSTTLTDMTTPTTTTIPTTTTTTTIPTTTTTTTIPTTTTPPSLPVECLNAINLTESWRLDHSGSDIRPINGIHNCDTRDMINSGRPWFRFLASAGSKLLNSCPAWDSCGTVCGIWSNSTMPSQVGVSVAFNAYVSCSRCDYYTRRVSVMTCFSAPYYFVYRYDDSSDQCEIGFCGMD